MSESKPNHAPAPWGLCNANGGRCACGSVLSIPADRVLFRIVPTHDGIKDASPREWTDEDFEIMRRIVRAVNAYDDLLAACEALLEASRNLRGEFVFTGDITARTLEPMFEADDEAQAAIAKAKENTP